ADRARSAEELCPAILLDRSVNLVLPTWENAIDRADRNARLARDLAHASANETVCGEDALRGIAHEPAVHRGARVPQRVPSSAFAHLQGIPVPRSKSQFLKRPSRFADRLICNPARHQRRVPLTPAGRAVDRSRHGAVKLGTAPLRGSTSASI